MGQDNQMTPAPHSPANRGLPQLPQPAAGMGNGSGGASFGGPSRPSTNGGANVAHNPLPPVPQAQVSTVVADEIGNNHFGPYKQPYNPDASTLCM